MVHYQLHISLWDCNLDKQNTSQIWAWRDTFLWLAIFIITSFTFRNSVAQGQTNTFLSLLCLTIVYFLGRKTLKTILIIAILFLPIIEIKPYLTIGIFLLLFFLHEWKLVLSTLIVIIFANFFYFVSLGISYVNWYAALKERALTVDSGSDQASLQSILKNALGIEGTPRILIIFLFTAFCLGFTLRVKKSLSSVQLVAIALTLPCLISPFLHAHDLVFALIGFLISIEGKISHSKSNKILIASLIVLHLNWTSANVLAGLIIETLLVLCLAILVPNLFGIWSWIAICFTSSFLTYTSWLSSQIQLTDRLTLYNLQSYLVGLLYFVGIVKLNKIKK